MDEPNSVAEWNRLLFPQQAAAPAGNAAGVAAGPHAAAPQSLEGWQGLLFPETRGESVASWIHRRAKEDSWQGVGKEGLGDWDARLLRDVQREHPGVDYRDVRDEVIKRGEYWKEARRLVSGQDFTTSWTGAHIPKEDRQLFLAILSDVAQSDSQTPGYLGALAGAVGRGRSRAFENLGTALDVVRDAPAEDTDTRQFFLKARNIVRGGEELKYEDAIKDDPIALRLAKQGSTGAAEMVPMLATSAVAGLGTSAVTANPLAGVGAGLAVWTPQTTGDAYTSLRQAGFSDVTAKRASLVAGPLLAAVEANQAKHIISPNVTGALRQKIMGLAAEYVKQMGEEATQEAIEMATKRIAQEVEKDVKIDWRAELDQSAESLYKAGKSLPFLMAPGAVGTLAQRGPYQASPTDAPAPAAPQTSQNAPGSTPTVQPARESSVPEQTSPAPSQEVQQASAGEPPPPARQPFVSQEELTSRQLRERGWSAAQIEEARGAGLFAKDNVTGFQEGRTGSARVDTVKRAIDHVGQSGESAVYAEIDLKNLGGMNSVLGHEKANGAFKAIAGIVQEELQGLGADVQLFRHGGDELSAVAVNADQATVEQALTRAQQRIQEYAQREGLADIEHPKYKGDVSRRGTGITFGITDIQASAQPADIFSAADRSVETQKKGASNVSGIASQATGFVAPTGLASGTASGAGEAGTGVSTATGATGSGTSATGSAVVPAGGQQRGRIPDRRGVRASSPGGSGPAGAAQRPEASPANRSALSPGQQEQLERSLSGKEGRSLDQLAAKLRIEAAAIAKALREFHQQGRLEELGEADDGSVIYRLRRQAKPDKPFKLRDADADAERLRILEAKRARGERPVKAETAAKQLTRKQRGYRDDAPAAESAQPVRTPPAQSQAMGKPFAEEIAAIVAASPDTLSQSIYRGKVAQRGAKYGDKVFIAHVWNEYQQAHPDATREDFNRQLIEANQRGDIELSRADLVQVMHPQDVAESEVPYLGTQFHLIQPGRSKPPKPTAPTEVQASLHQLFQGFLAVEQGDRSKNFVNLADLQDRLGWNRTRFLAVLKEARKRGILTLSAAEGRHGISDRDRRAGLIEDGGLLLFASRKEGSAADEAMRRAAAPDILGYGEADLPRMPVNDNPDADGRAESRHAIVRAMSELFGVPIRLENVKRNLKAMYDWRPEAAFIRGVHAGELPLTTHEVAHHIDKTHPSILSGTDEATANELAGLDYNASRADVHEGFAEYLRLRLTDDNAAQVAPLFDAYFEQWLNGHQELQRQLSQVRRWMDNYRNASPLARETPNVLREGQTVRPAGETRVSWWQQRIAAGIEEAVVMFKDEAHQLELYTRKLGEKRVLFAPGESPIDLYRAFAKSGAVHAKQWLEQGVYSLKDRSRLGPSLKEVYAGLDPKDIQKFETWLWARHAIEANRKGHNPGMKREDAQRIHDEYRSDDWERRARQFEQFSAALGKVLVEAGYHTQEEYDRIYGGWKTYVPLERALGLAGRVGSGRGIANVPSPVKGRSQEGSGLPIISPADVMVRRAQQTAAVAGKQLILNAVARGADSAEGMGRWVTRLAAKDSEGHAGHPQNRPGEDATVRVIKDGKPAYYLLDKDLMRFASGMEQLQMPWFLKPIVQLAKLERLTRTGLSVTFAARNLWRDARTYLGNIKHGSPQDVAALPAVWSARLLKERLGGQKDAISELFTNMGGELANELGLDRNAIRLFADTITGREQSLGRRALRGFGKAVDWTRDFFSIGEQAYRLAQFEMTLKHHGWGRARIDRQGADAIPMNALIDALNDAKNVTLDFSRMGRLGKQINAVVPFFNARIEAKANWVRLWRQNPKRAAILAAASIAAGLSYWWLHRDEDWWRESPAWLKFGNWVITKDGKPWMRLPMNDEWDVLLAGLPMAIADALYRREPTAFVDWSKQAGDSLNPGVDFLGYLPVPRFAGRGLLETAINRDLFRDKPIVPESLGERREPKDQFQPWTTDSAKWVAGVLHEADIKVSPAKLEHLIDSVFGGLPSSAVRLAEGKDRTTERLPVISGFSLRSDYSRSSEEFHSKAREIEQALGSAKASGKITSQLEQQSYEIGKYQDLLTELRKLRAGVVERDERFATQRFEIGLARHALGKEALDRHPNPLTADNLPASVQAIRDEWLAKVLQSASHAKPQRQNGENADRYGERLDRWEKSIDRAEALLSPLKLSAHERRWLLQEYLKEKGQKQGTRSAALERLRKHLAGLD